jgi:hypothetical protein
LEISWLKNENEGNIENQLEPAALAQEAIQELTLAINELHGILTELGISEFNDN